MSAVELASRGQLPPPLNVVQLVVWVLTRPIALCSRKRADRWYTNISTTIFVFVLWPLVVALYLVWLVGTHRRSLPPRASSVPPHAPVGAVRPPQRRWS